MPPKPAGEAAKPPPKKNIKGKNQGFELDSTPPTAGDGVFVYKDGNAKYEGQWQRFDGVMKRHGTGIYTDCGATYDGHFVEDKYEGFGVFTSVDGAVYKGEWKNGLMHGHGVYTWPDKAIFDGQWENGLMEGPGTFTDPSGRIWTGTWTHGEAELENVPVS